MGGGKGGSKAPPPIDPAGATDCFRADVSSAVHRPRAG
jgi:hypothetical protein